MKIVGYMEGTNPEILTQLLLEGYETIPLSNGFDNHGKLITNITTQDHISLIVGHLHKFIPVSPTYTMTDILSSVRLHKIPAVFVVPTSTREKADKMLKDKGVEYTLVEPSQLSNTLFNALKNNTKS